MWESAWATDISATKPVDEKARRAFFHYGSIGVFQGDICSLSSRSILESCVMPVLLYGCENWIMTETLWEKLEAFQGVLAKRILKWPKHHSNTVAATLLEVQTMRCRVLSRKLCFLQRLVNSNSASLGGGTAVPAGDVGKCLGYWWKGDISATKPVDEKARRAFFHYGSIGVFQGDICSLSSRSILESCVMPVLLYGCENWIMTETLWEKLEAFQGVLAKRILKWPKHHSNTVAATVLEVQTMRCRVLSRKLCFLQRLVNSNSASLGGRAMLALSDDTASLCLVRECRELEEVFGTHYAEDILSNCIPLLKEVKDAILECDRGVLTAKCSAKAPVIAEVAACTSWSKLWDGALDLGDKAVRGLQFLSRAMSHHGYGNHPCPICDTAPLPTTVIDHVLDSHQASLFLKPTMCTAALIDLLEDSQLSVLCNFCKLYKY